MMGGEERRRVASLPRPFAEQAVAQRAGAGLDIAGDRRVGGESRVRDAEAGADLGDEGGLGGAFGAQAMIDGGGAHPAGKGGMSEEQQSEAVRPARDGDAERAGIAAGQRFEIGAEAGGGLVPSACAP